LFRSKKTLDPTGVEHPPIKPVQLILKQRPRLLSLANTSHWPRRFRAARRIILRRGFLGLLHGFGVQETASPERVKLIAERRRAI
jgi:hypothetical protein